MNILRRQWYSSQLKFNLPYQEVLLKDQPSWMTIRAQLCMHEQAIDGKMQMCGFVDVRTAMPKNRPGPDEAYKLCHMWLKRLQTKTAALAMITQHMQTYASHVDFDSFTVFMCLFRCKKILKNSSA